MKADARASKGTPGWFEALVQSERARTTLAWAAFASGTIWRWRHIFHLHDPRDYEYSDMAMYVRMAKQFAEPGYTLTSSDLTHPPGLTTVMAWLYSHDPTLLTMVWFQFAVCALVPLAVGGLGWVSFGRTTGQAALAASSLYFPFIDYGGYFLTEIYFIFSLPLGVALMLLANRQPNLPRMAAVGALAGLAFSVAMATKVLAFPAVACLLVAYLALWRNERSTRRMRAVVALAIAIGATPINTWQIARCTEANHHFCLGSNKGASDFLLGHYGRICTIRWHDPNGGETSFGSPSATQHGYGDNVDVDFAVTDNAKNVELAWKRIKEHPRQAVLLSFEHVYDLFLGSFPWPSASTNFWVGAAGGHYLFICLLLFPTCVRLLDIVRKDGVRGLLRSTEFLLLAPIIGLIVTAAIATGEPRYRIPFDSLFMIVAIQFFRHAFSRAEVPADVGP